MRNIEVFQNYEAIAKNKCGIDNYKFDTSRKRRRKTFADEISNTDNVINDGSQNMRINVYYVILDNLRTQLKKRKEAYVLLNDRFGFLMHLDNLNYAEIQVKAENLVIIYENDLEESLVIECQHFGAHLQSLGLKKMSALKIMDIICSNNYEIIYPNVHIAMKIFLCMMVSNCTGERSFSVLRRVKNYLRSTLSDERLNCLALLCIEADITLTLNFDSLIDEFALKKSRKEK